VIRLVYETHSITTDNECGFATGWFDGQLSPRGRELARALGVRRADADVVLSSDLGRAVETAAIAFAGSGIPVLHDWRLRECDYGDLNGAPKEMLDPPAHAESPYPNGESYRDVVRRVASFLEDVRRFHDGRYVVVVSHAAPRWALQHLLEGTPLPDAIAAPFEWQEGWEYTLSTT
jgi:broad specificity phosphatase PhoE